MSSPTFDNGNAINVGDGVYVHAFGGWRYGNVVKLGRTRVTVGLARNQDGDMHVGTYPASELVHPAGWEVRKVRDLREGDLLLSGNVVKELRTGRYSRLINIVMQDGSTAEVGTQRTFLVKI